MSTSRVTARRCPLCGTDRAIWGNERRSDGVIWNIEQSIVVGKSGRSVRLTGRQILVFDILWRARPAGLNWQRLADVAWSEHETIDFTPMGSTVRALIYRMNKRLAGIGIRIGGEPEGALGHYKDYRMLIE